MKKIIVILTAILITITLMSGCDYHGYDIIDLKYHYDRAIIKLPDGNVVDVEIEKWAYIGDQMKITATEGTVYLVSPYNCMLIDDKNSSRS